MRLLERSKLLKMKRGQVWVETVVYTLVGLALMGLVLSLVIPKINAYRDRALIEQTIAAFESLDSTLQESLDAPGNVRIIDFRLKRGKLVFDSDKDLLKFNLPDSKVVYSEPGVNTSIGPIGVLTVENPKSSNVQLTLQISANMTFDDKEGMREFSAAATPYRFRFENLGSPEVGLAQILDVTEVSIVG